MEERSQCPEVEVVERYVRGELPAPAAEEVRAHLEVCGICCVVVERLRELEAAVSPGSRGAEPNWETMERRLAEECRRMYPEKAKQAERSRWGWWVPALGYGLVVILAYPAWLGISRRPGEAGVSAPAVQPVGGAALVDLNTTRAGQSLPVVVEREGETAAVLTFFVRAAAGTRLSVAIVDGAGRVVQEFREVRSSDDQGNYCVVVDPHSLPLGKYRLTAKDSNRPAESGTSFEFVRQ